MEVGCSRCREVQPINAFPIVTGRNGTPYLGYVCKKCIADASRQIMRRRYDAKWLDRIAEYSPERLREEIDRYNERISILRKLLND